MEITTKEIYLVYVELVSPLVCYMLTTHASYKTSDTSYKTHSQLNKQHSHDFIIWFILKGQISYRWRRPHFIRELKLIENLMQDL
ncbi:hypothetical protein Lal_00042075 [Lupinus albus]|nr:hypothetical protein Lal_00042075 [Lupinus albus]